MRTVQFIYNFKHVWSYTPGNCVESWYFFIQETAIAHVTLETLKGTSCVYTCMRDNNTLPNHLLCAYVDTCPTQVKFSILCLAQEG